MRVFKVVRGFPSGSVVKNLPAKQEMGFGPWVEKIPWRRVWQLDPVFLPRKFHGLRSLAGYGPWGRQRIGHDLTTEQQQQPQQNHERRIIWEL